ncbi:MAG TPA: hypothetical protein VFP96_17095 [Candidatus Acidoferrum sp.]|jgi:membrane protease YdiL (CAAX protease family)|nr:hypothetical protein [Candidatus Acidoferrum sp.]
MNAIYLQLRLIHTAFLVSWFLFIFVLRVANPPEQTLPFLLPVGLVVVAISIVAVGFKMRQGLLEPHAAVLASTPEDPALLQRWRLGNLLAFCFAEFTMLLGVILKFLGERWNVVGAFFAVGLLLLLLWTPRKLQAMPRGVR